MENTTTLQPEPVFADALFFGYIHPHAAPGLLLDAQLKSSTRTTELPWKFLMPLAGPNGQTIGHIEFHYHTTQGKLGRYAAVALHSASMALPALPSVPTLTPINVSEPAKKQHLLDRAGEVFGLDFTKSPDRVTG